MSAPRVSVVIIGRNEGVRLRICITAVRGLDFPDEDLEIIYVDSHSTDGSLKNARRWGAGKAVAVPPGPTTAALGRNTGLALAKGQYVFFLDGDTRVEPEFLQTALDYLEAHPDVAGVCGDRREMMPELSLYNRIQHVEWNGPEGDVAYFGGDAVVRKSVLDAVGGYNAALPAGEEPELCHRIRAAGHRIVHLAVPMTVHDIAMTEFSQYWRRSTRTGYAYAQVADMTGGETWGRERNRNRLQGMLYLFGPVLGLTALGVEALPWLLLGAGLLVGRTFVKNRHNGLGTVFGLQYAVHAHLCQIPIFLGQLKYLGNRRARVTGGLIEYK